MASKNARDFRSFRTLSVLVAGALLATASITAVAVTPDSDLLSQSQSGEQGQHSEDSGLTSGTVGSAEHAAPLLIDEAEDAGNEDWDHFPELLLPKTRAYGGDVSPGKCPAVWEAEVLRLTNAERKKVGSPALSAAGGYMSSAADQWAQLSAQREDFQHANSKWVQSRIGSPGRWIAENIAWNYGTPKLVMQGWMGSPGHARNIRYADAQKMALGCYADAYGSPYWVQMFFSETDPSKGVAGVTVSGGDLYNLKVGQKLTASGSSDYSYISLAWMRTGPSVDEEVKVAEGWTYTVTAADLKPGVALEFEYFYHKNPTPPSTWHTGASIRLPGQPGEAIAPFVWQTTRRSGKDRYDTSLAIVKATATKGEPVFVATGASYADALSAGAAAGKLGGTLALTPRNSLDPKMLAQIRALSPSAIYVIGGRGAVSDGVMSTLKTVTANTERVGGKDRYETSRAIANRFFSQPAEVYLATGRDFPDALAASAVAGGKGVPVLLVDGRAAAIDEETRQTVSRLGAKSLVIAGGTGAVSSKIESQLKSQGYSVSRKAGKNRYGTAVALNAGLKNQDAAWLVSGNDFPDAVGAAAAAAGAKAPMYLSAKSCMNGETKKALLAMTNLKQVTLAGGTGVLSRTAARFGECY